MWEKTEKLRINGSERWATEYKYFGSKEGLINQQFVQ